MKNHLYSSPLGYPQQAGYAPNQSPRTTGAQQAMTSAPADPILQSVLQSVEKLNRRDFRNYLEDFAPGYKMWINSSARPLDLQESFHFMKQFIQMLPGVQLQVDQIFPSQTGEFLCYVFTATADGTDHFYGFPASRGAIEFRGTTIYRLRDGRREESWNFWDNLGILHQAGFLDGPTDELPRASPRQTRPGTKPTTKFQTLPIVQGPAIYPGEQLTIGHAKNRGQIRYDRGLRFIPASGESLSMDDESLGNQETVAKIIGVPVGPRGPGPLNLDMNQPTGLPEIPRYGNFKTIFHFNEQDSLYVTGLSVARISVSAGGDSLFFFAAAGLVVGGTGAFQGAFGVACENGSNPLPGPRELDSGTIFDYNSLFNWRLQEKPEPGSSKLFTPTPFSSGRTSRNDFGYKHGGRHLSRHRNEEVLLFYTIGKASVHEGAQGLYVVGKNQTFDLDGSPRGVHNSTVAVVDPPTEPDSPILQSFNPNLSSPDGFPKIQDFGQSKGIFIFNEQDSIAISGQGPATFVPYKNGATLFKFSEAALIIEGTGKFAGVQGSSTVMGAALLPKGTEFEPGSVLGYKMFFVLRFTYTDQRPPL